MPRPSLSARAGRLAVAVSGMVVALLCWLVLSLAHGWKAGLAGWLASMGGAAWGIAMTKSAADSRPAARTRSTDR